MKLNSIFVFAVIQFAYSNSERITRYECEFQINIPSSLILDEDHCGKGRQKSVKMSVGRGDVGSRTIIYRCADLNDQTSMTVTVAIEKKQMKNARRIRCNDRSIHKSHVVQRLGNIGGNITITARTKKDYRAQDFPQDCQEDEVSYPHSPNCGGRGHLCVSQQTRTERCSCKREFKGKNCEHIR